MVGLGEAEEKILYIVSIGQGGADAHIVSGPGLCIALSGFVCM